MTRGNLSTKEGLERITVGESRKTENSCGPMSLDIQISIPNSVWCCNSSQYVVVTKSTLGHISLVQLADIFALKLIATAFNCDLYYISIVYKYLNFIFSQISWIFLVVVDGRGVDKNPPDFWQKSGGFFDDFIMRSVRFAKSAGFLSCVRFVFAKSAGFWKIRRIFVFSREPNGLLYIKSTPLIRD